MSNVFGSCLDKHTLWSSETDENGITTVTFTSNVEDQEDVSICFGLKGATLNGEPVAIEDGILILEDMFGSGVVDEEAGTYTLTLPGQDPVVLCTNPLKAFEQDPATGVITATAQDGTPSTANVTTIVDNGDNTATATNFDGTSCDVVKVSAFSVDNTDPENPQVSLTLPGIVMEDISDDISIEMVTITDNENGTGSVTGTEGPNSPTATTCTFLKTPVAWTPADPSDPTTWLADPANPGDVLSWVKEDDVTCGFILNGAVCTVPKSSLSDNGDGTAKAIINGVECDLSTARYDDSDNCWHVWRDSKDDSEIMRHRRRDEPQSLVSNSPALQFNITADINAAAEGDELFYEVCNTLTNTSDCRNCIADAHPHLSSATGTFMPEDWALGLSTQSSIDGGPFIGYAAGWIDTRANTGRANVSTLDSADRPHCFFVGQGQTIEICNRVRVAVAVKGPDPVANVGLSGLLVPIKCQQQ